MKPFLVIADLDNPAAQPFVVLSVDPTQREGDGCKAIVMSLHWTRAEAEAAIQESASMIMAGQCQRCHGEGRLYRQDCGAHGFQVPCPDCAGVECPFSPTGRHIVDTSMESGPNNCFHCEARMR